MTFRPRNFHCESAAVCYLRALAVVLILVCHLLECYGNPWSACFYVGVPIFFLLSGYLYGSRLVTDWRFWAFRRLRRLYVPYLAFLLPVLAVFAVVYPEHIGMLRSVVYVLGLQGFTGGAAGLNHLWFFTAILACYASLPLLQRGRRHADGFFLLGMLVLAVDFWLFKGRFYWFPLYAVAYFGATASRSVRRSGFAVVLAATLWQLFSWKRSPLFDVSTQYVVVRSLVAMLVVGGVLGLFRSMAWSRVWRPVAWLSGVSFPLYLVHNVLMVGPFSLKSYVSSTTSGVLLMIAASLLWAEAINRLMRR